ncbi:ABC transporter ATPase [Sphingobacteriales bacterium UPWRP_1]|nr:hypothetical protein B6N25_01280 [Sphingobacteriales bacterium TSM_CSS]PSJ74890.1 ABC transporter ATPase [Sphingobacteriales bacterium UPWRP_1]
MTPYNLMPADAKVWIYQSSRPFTAEELPQLTQQIEEFAQQWVRHGKLLKAWGGVLHRQFVVLMVDEAALSAGGCSIDASTRMLKELEKQYGISLFDRLTIAYRTPDGHIATASRNQFEQLLANGQITLETNVFNNLINTKTQLETEWEVPVYKSWHKQLVS